MRMIKILLVEDDDLNQRMLMLRLGKMGYDVTTANNGREAIDKARNDQPDIILMDMDLPEVNGWEATRILKSSTQTVNIPVIAVTANAMAGDREKALDAGCDDYESKPINYTSLEEKINRLTNTKP